MKTSPIALGIALIFTPLAGAAPSAAEIISAAGVKGGLIVHLGAGDGTLTAALRLNEGYMVQGLDVDGASVQRARMSLRAKGLYGSVSVERYDGVTLPYIENFVNLLVAEELGKVTLEEVNRVLVPEGVAYFKKGGAWTKVVKPRPDDIDEWTHYFHGPSGNAVAQDKVVAPPR
ncbi:MAG: class I SAM-dependent methyltransferase, partial [Roseibacillus sp.]